MTVDYDVNISLRGFREILAHFKSGINSNCFTSAFIVISTVLGFPQSIFHVAALKSDRLSAYYFQCENKSVDCQVRNQVKQVLCVLPVFISLRR